MANKRSIYRDDDSGQFISHDEYLRREAEGDGATEETVEEETIDDLFEYDDYDDGDLYDFEYHGTGDTGRSSE
jgi:hypothetical protein